MKHKVSISVEEETIIKIRDAMRQGKFRNKSHAFEFAINEVLGNKFPDPLHKSSEVLKNE
jgi:hypothetical protein